MKTKMQFPTLLKQVCFILCLFHFIFTDSFGQQDPFNGKFSIPDVGLEIQLQNNNNQYTGNFVVQGHSFPVTAQLDNVNSLSGFYPYEGNNVPFNITNSGQGYVLTTEGMNLPISFQPIKAPAKGLISSMAQKSNTSTPSKSAPSSSTSVPVSGSKSGGKLIKMPSMGYTLNAPDGWVHKDMGQGSHFFGHNSKPGLVLVLPHDYSDKAAIIHDVKTEGIVDETVQLYLDGEIADYGANGLYANFKGMSEGQSIKAAATTMLSPYGGGLTVLALTTADKFTDEYKSITKSVANSMKFMQPVESALVKDWKSRITGKLLKYMNTGDNSTSTTTYSLYTNGAFRYYNSSSYSSVDHYVDHDLYASSASQDDDTGTWEITGSETEATLVVTYKNGKVGRLGLESKEGSRGQIYLNGSRYFILDLE